MIKQNFYSLDSKYNGSSVVTCIKNDLSLEEILKLFRAEIKINEEIIISIDRGTSFKDIIQSTIPIILISENLKLLLEKGKVSGCQCVPVHFSDQTINKDYKYFLLQILGKCGEITKDSSKFKLNNSGNEFIEISSGLSIDVESWDGSDLFSPINSGYIFITDKVKKIIEENKITGYEIKKIEEIESLV